MAIRWILAGIAMLAGCARSAPTSTLEYSFDARELAGVAAEHKAEIAVAQEQVERARSLVQVSEDAVRDAKLELRLAQNKHTQADLEVEACKDKKRVADKCYDRARIDFAQSELLAAKIHRATAARRVEFVAANLELCPSQR